MAAPQMSRDTSALRPLMRPKPKTEAGRNARVSSPNTSV
jgi:hypothetical protein